MNNKIKFQLEPFYFLEVKIKYKKHTGFPKYLYYLISKRKLENIKDIIKKEFTKNIKISKFLNDNNIIVNIYEIYKSIPGIVENISQLIIKNENTNYTKFNEQNLLESIKIIDIKNIKISEYIKCLNIKKLTQNEFEIKLDDFKLKELYLIKNLLEKDLKELLKNLKEETTYNKEFNRYHVKYKLLNLIKIKTEKLLEIHENTKKRKNY